MERDFPEGADSLDGVDRRVFLKIMAASFALGGAGLAAAAGRSIISCLSASRSRASSRPAPVLRDGDAAARRRSAAPGRDPSGPSDQAGRQSALRPDRRQEFSPGPGFGAGSLRSRPRDRSYPEGRHLSAEAAGNLLSSLGRTYAASRGAGLAFLAEESSSPTRARLLEALQRKAAQGHLGGIRAGSSGAAVAAAQAVFGRAVKPIYHLPRPSGSSRSTRTSSIRKPHAAIRPRIFPGAAGDRSRRRHEPSLRGGEQSHHDGQHGRHRLRLATSHMTALAAAVAAKVTSGGTSPPGGGPRSQTEWVAECAADLSGAKGEVCRGGGSSPARGPRPGLRNQRRPRQHRQQRSNSSKSPLRRPRSRRSRGHRRSRSRPCHPRRAIRFTNAPADLGWRRAAEVGRRGHPPSVTTPTKPRLWRERTSPPLIILESCGRCPDVEWHDLPIQPMILPLFAADRDRGPGPDRGESTTDPHQLVQTTLAGLAQGDDGRRGFPPLPAGKVCSRAPNTASVSVELSSTACQLDRRPLALAPVSKDALEIRFVLDYKVDDGRFRQTTAGSRVPPFRSPAFPGTMPSWSAPAWARNWASVRRGRCCRWPGRDPEF